MVEREGKGREQGGMAMTALKYVPLSISLSLVPAKRVDAFSLGVYV